MALPDQLTTDEIAELTHGYDQSAADVSDLLSRDYLHRWLADEGPVIATSRLFDQLMDLPDEIAAGYAAHLAVRLLEQQRAGGIR